MRKSITVAILLTEAAASIFNLSDAAHSFSSVGRRLKKSIWPFKKSPILRRAPHNVDILRLLNAREKRRYLFDDQDILVTMQTWAPTQAMIDRANSISLECEAYDIPFVIFVDTRQDDFGERNISRGEGTSPYGNNFYHALHKHTDVFEIPDYNPWGWSEDDLGSWLGITPWDHADAARIMYMDKTGADPDFWWSIEDDVGIVDGVISLMSSYVDDKSDLLRAPVLIPENHAPNSINSCGELRTAADWNHYPESTQRYQKIVGKQRYASSENIERRSRKLNNAVRRWYQQGIIATSEQLAPSMIVKNRDMTCSTFREGTIFDDIWTFGHTGRISEGEWENITKHDGTILFNDGRQRIELRAQRHKATIYHALKF